MSVVVRLPPALVEVCGGGCDIRIYVKGADSIMLTLLAPGSYGTDGAEKKVRGPFTRGRYSGHHYGRSSRDATN